MAEVDVYLRSAIGSELQLGGKADEFRFEPYGVVQRQGDKERIIPWWKVDLAWRPARDEVEASLHV